jgi:CBS domain containing-hemolysin-like protein
MIYSNQMGNLIILIIAIVAGSAFFSGLEAALFSVSSSRAKILEQQGKRNAKYLVKIKESMSRPIVVIVIGNNITNIAGSILVGVLTIETLGHAWIGVISTLTILLIITIGEIIPKTLGERYAETISLLACRPLLFSTRIFRPVISLLEKITDGVSKAPSDIVSEEELKILSNIGHMQGEIEKDERDMIRKVFSLNDIKAKDIMTPRTVIVALESQKNLREISEEIYLLRNSRLPIYTDNLDNIIGVANRIDLLIALAKNKTSAIVSDFAQPAPYVDESMRVDDLLSLFKKERHHLAIVKDKFGGTSGIVTLEDAIEQLVGEIVDETDKYTDMRKRALKQNKDA